MPVSKNVNEMQKNATAEREPATNSFRQRARNTPGTRYGTWQDWRGVSERTGKVSNRHGNVIRDGR